MMLFFRRLLNILLPLLFSLLALHARAQEERSPAPTVAGEQEDLYIVEPGELPDYDALRFQDGEESNLGENYLSSLPSFSDDVITSTIVFPEVPEDEPYARLALPELVDLALQRNFQLENAERNLRIARSSTRQAEALFIPFVDLVADSRFSEDRDENATTGGPLPGSSRNTTRESSTFNSEAGAETGVTLPTGGQLLASGGQTRTESRATDGTGLLEDSRGFESDAQVRFVQPLLRGGGTDVGTASLRRARINELDSILSFRLQQRDIVFSVVSTYFQLLQSARQLQVSADLIQRRLQVVEENRIRLQKGRVDESQVLTAETQYLSQLETAIGQRRQLDEQRENILLLLGLPLDTPISFIDITDSLAGRGRVDIPPPRDAMTEALSNRKELMRQDLAIARAEIENRVAVNDVLPELDLEAGYGRRDASTEHSNSTGFESSSWDAGVSLRIPLVNIERRQAARQSALSLENAATNKTSLRRDLTQEVLQAHRNLLSTEAQLTVVKKNVEQARRALELITERFEVGFATNTEVRLAQDDLFAAETRYNNTLLNYQIQLARLYVALGRPLINY